MNRPFLNLISGGAILFDGLQAVSWFVHMQSDINSPRMVNISPGEIYVFIFTQDGVGGHRVNWLINCINAASIDPTPNSTTIQTFIGNTVSLLYANVTPSRTRGNP